VIYVAQHAVYI